MEAAQQALVEDLGRAVERVVRVRVVVLVGRELARPGRRPRPTTRRRRFSTLACDRRFEDVEGAVDQDLEREPRLLGALGDADRGLVEDDVDAVASARATQLAVADVALDEPDGPLAMPEARFVAPAADEVVEEP